MPSMDSTIVNKDIIETINEGINRSVIQANKIILKSKITGSSIIVGNLIVDIKSQEDLNKLIGPNVIIIGLINGISPSRFFNNFGLSVFYYFNKIEDVECVSVGRKINSEYIDDAWVVNDSKIDKSVITNIKLTTDKQIQTEDEELLIFSNQRINDKDLLGCTKELLDYLTNEIKNKEISFKTELEKYEVQGREKFKCLISNDYVEIPVFVGGYLFDFDSIKNLSVDDEGKREHHKLKSKFTMSDVQPGLMAFNELIDLISKAEAELGNDENWELMKEAESSKFFANKA